MITATRNGVVIDVRVIPRAAKSGIAGARDNALLVRVNAPPVEGAANQELIAVIARVMDVPRSAVSILAGDRSRNKRVFVAGLTREDAQARAVAHD